MQTERLCIDCRHYKPRLSNVPDADRCTHPALGLSPVTGEQVTTWAAIVRLDGGHCGPSGRNFERPSPSSMSMEALLASAPVVPRHQQTRLGSLIEALTNTAVGFCISMAFSAIVYPLYGWHPSLAINFQITMWFTILSIGRGYVLRRAFTRIKELHS